MDLLWLLCRCWAAPGVWPGPPRACGQPSCLKGSLPFPDSLAVATPCVLVTATSLTLPVSMAALCCAGRHTDFSSCTSFSILRYLRMGFSFSLHSECVGNKGLVQSVCSWARDAPPLVSHLVAACVELTALFCQKGPSPCTRRSYMKLCMCDSVISCRRQDTVRREHFKLLRLYFELNQHPPHTYHLASIQLPSSLFLFSERAYLKPPFPFS